MLGKKGASTTTASQGACLPAASGCTWATPVPGLPAYSAKLEVPSFMDSVIWRVPSCRAGQVEQQ